MRFTLHSKYKSLEVGSIDIDLPNFTILTGLNGSGKTQILEAMLMGQLRGEFINIEKILINNGSLSPNDKSDRYYNNDDDTISMLWQYYVSNRNTSFENLHIEKKYLDKISKIATLSKKDLLSLDRDDFEIYCPLDISPRVSNFYEHTLSYLFRAYHKRLDKIRYMNYTKSQEEGHVPITEDQVTSFLGPPPWKVINDILENSNLPYRVTYPTGNFYDMKFEAKLKDVNKEFFIDFKDLSSGEQIIMSFIIGIYNLTLGFRLPSIILLDEVDASLHPSMAKYFLKILQETFIDEYRLSIVLATHSPSVVAFAPEDSIHLVTKEGSQRIIKVTRDRALKALTEGVPSFSINYENRRQVFVESHNDVSYYEELYKKFSNYLIPEISLTFISSGESRKDSNGRKVSTCDQVENITSVLRKGGNKFVFGIVDGDGKSHKEKDGIILLGEGKRYSIENYLFDPLLLGALLLRQKLLSKTDLGLTQEESYTDLKSFSQERLQKIIDFISNALSIEGELIDYRIVKGVNLKIPSNYLEIQGHKLESLVLRVYSKLNEIKRDSESALKMEILTKIVDDLVEIVPIDLLDTLRKIQSQ
ncbi:AAA family ATPase [Runella zeae]|uniref:AAA family ATPase n=1 Tax=Runella zeae TaxID=94255 RepID=UPI002353B0A4|nr:AAA family ATPase [Runella zeae]